MLRVRTFGGLAAWVGEVPVPEVRGAKARSLFAFLALNPGPHPRVRLAGRFWPDVLDTSARGSLRGAVWSIRAALDAAGGAAYVRADRAAVGLAPARDIDVDTAEFARLVDAGDPASLERAVALAVAPPLPELADEWVLDEQERHRERLIEALLSLADHADLVGDLRGGLSWTRRALAQDRLRESTHRELMRRMAIGGDRAGALAAYRRCRDALVGELGVPPSGATRALAEEIRQGDVPRDASGAEPAAPAVRAATPTGHARPALVGRDAELRRLGAAWARAVAGEGGVVVIDGAAGMGKSRLVTELVSVAEAEGALVGVGHVTDIDEAPPFGAWSDAMRQLVRACPSPPADTSWPEELARLCPAVEASWDRHPGAPIAEPTLGRARLFESVAEALEWCQRVAPTLVVLEDAHAGDSAGLALAAHIGPRLARARTLLVLTARGGAVGEPVARVRDALVRQGAVRDGIHLAALGSDEVLSIVRGVAPGLDPGVAARVAEGAAGSPLLALRAAHAAAAGADPETAVCDAVRAPVAGLSEPARMLVAVAAVAGRGLTLREAASAVGARAADAAIEEAVAAGLLDMADGRVVFAHELLRRACHAELPAARRRAAHAAMAEVLSGSGYRAPAEVAHHLRGAGDEERARAYLRAAATAARALGALDQAAAFLRELAMSARGAGDAAAEGDAWIALAEIEAWRGDRDALDAAFARGRAALEAAGDIAGLAAALAERGRWLRTTTCYPPEVHRCSREALELLERAGIDAPETRLLALAGMAWGEAVAGDPVRGARLQAVVGALLRETPDPVLRCEHLITRAFALLRMGRCAAAREVCAEAAALADECAEPALALDARVAQATAAAFEGLFEEVVRILDEQPDAVRVGPTLACQALAGRAHALSRLGRHDAAVAAAREQVSVARSLATADVEATAGADLGAVLLAAGRAADALDVLEGVLADAAQRVPRAATRLLAAEAALATGDPSRAAAHLDRFPFDPVRAGDHPETLVARLDRVAGLVRIAQGDTAGGVALLDEAAGRWSVLAADARPAGETAREELGVMIDLGRAPVAGLTEPGLEVERIVGERARALRAVTATNPEVV